MNSNATTCPPTEILNDFVEGKLEPPTLDECELHIAECPACLETLRGLGTEDTLTGHVAAAMNEPDATRSSVPLDNLLERMLKQPQEFKSLDQAQGSHLPAELMADRAAEVLRCIEPTDNQSLGALGDYDLERLIGTGSSGVVFKATDRTLNRTVALKVLRPSLGEMARQRFISEARSAASIEHPNVVTIYQVGQADRLAFMAMQWIPGQTLEQLLAGGRVFDEDEIRKVARQVATGLQVAHDRQIIHRDIKPANIWITEQDRSVRILDFGLARIADDNPGLTATGMLAGTPNFMSPEQTKGLELDGRSDLFSLGCLMYRLATGRLPFGASTVLATLQAIQNHQPPSVQCLQPNCGDDLTDVTMALLEKQPANRPESASQLVEILNSERASWPVQINRYSAESKTAGSVTKAQPSSSRSNGNFGRWIISTIALGLIGFGGVFFAPQIIRILTDQGEIVIETDDPDVEIEILKDGKTFRVVDTKTDQSFDIRSGSYEIRAKANPEADQSVAFDVTPERLIMKRGQQQIVTVTKTEKTRVRRSPDNVDSGLLGGGSPSNDLENQSIEMASERPTKRTYPISVDPKAAFDLLGTVLEGSDARIQQDDVSGAITVLGLKEDFKVVEELLALVGNGEGNRPVNNQRGPVYDGKNFDQWIDVAETDRYPKSVAGAIRACSALTETDAQRKKLLEILSGVARRRDEIDDGGEYVLDATLEAIWRQPPELAADFVEEQLQNGNSSSLQICFFMMNNFQDTSMAPYFSKFRQAIASRLNILLPLYIKRNQPIDGPIASANSLSRKELLMLNPNLASLVAKLFWAETKLEDAQLEKRQSIAPLGSLAAKLRIDDVKIVEYLADQYLEHIWEDNREARFVYDNYLEAFTNKTNDWGYVRDYEFQPFVGWHDELRLNLFLEILQTELSDKAVRHRGVDKPGSKRDSKSQMSYQAAYQKVYKIQECLNAILPDIDSEVRRRTKEKLAEIKRDLPKEFKSVAGKKLDTKELRVDHNLEALIATCDGKTKPAFIRPQQDWRNGKFPLLDGELLSDGMVVGKSDGIIGLDPPQVDSQPDDGLPKASDNLLVYEGQNFEHWLNLAKTDRSPKVVADAIRACGALAETDAQRKELFKIIEIAALQHGTWVQFSGRFGSGQEGDDTYVMRAVLKAIWSQPPELAVDFVEAQLKNGNSRSIEFCGCLLNGPEGDLIPRNNAKFLQAFASRLNVLLPLAVKRHEPLVYELVNTAGFVSRKELLKLNPNLDSLVVNLFWEKAKLKNSRLVGVLGRLAAYLRVDDKRMVEYLANRYMKRISRTNGIYDEYFRALTDDLTDSWYSESNYRPLFGWHDELRFGILLKILHAELSDEAVRSRGRGKPNPNFDGQYLVVYRVQECLHELLPTMDSEVRRQAKKKLAETKLNLPEVFKSTTGKDSNIENNLDALIAICDGKTEPAFIKVLDQTQGSSNGNFVSGAVMEESQQQFEGANKPVKVPSNSQANAGSKGAGNDPLEADSDAEQQGDPAAVQAATATAKAHLRGLFLADFKTSEDTYAAKVTLMPGHEFLKPKFGLAGPKGRSGAVTVPQAKLLKAMKEASNGPKLSGKEIDELFKKFTFGAIKEDPKDGGINPADPVATANGKLDFEMKAGDVLLKVGPGSGDDFLLFQLRKIDSKWKVVAEYLD